MNPTFEVDYVTSGESADPRDWIQQARTFLAAAELLHAGHSFMPWVMLIGYSIELALKAFLLENGRTALGYLRELSHNLPRIRDEAVAVGLPRDLLSADSATSIGALFHALPGVPGKMRAVVYPAKKQGRTLVMGDFQAVVANLVEYCETEISGPRDPQMEAVYLEKNLRANPCLTREQLSELVIRNPRRRPGYLAAQRRGLAQLARQRLSNRIPRIRAARAGR